MKRLAIFLSLFAGIFGIYSIKFRLEAFAGEQNHTKVEAQSGASGSYHGGGGDH